MNTKNIIIAALTGGLMSTAALGAGIDLTITGSTAFSSIAYDRVPALFDAGMQKYTNSANANQFTYVGTVGTKIPSLGATQVRIRVAFSGSAAGMLAVRDSTPIATLTADNTTANIVPDLSFSDVYPESATPSIDGTVFDQSIVGVVPFVFVKNNGLAGIVNITRDQAVVLMDNSGMIDVGVPGMPATWLGGTSPDPVYLVGRNSGSGSRITVEKDINYIGGPSLWATNPPSTTWVRSTGLSAGSDVRKTVAAKADAIGYMGPSDAAQITATATSLTYNGVAYSAANVASGKYALSGYVHLVNRAGALTAEQQAINDQLVADMTDPVYQAGAPYTPSFVPLSEMKVQRGADGGILIPTDWTPVP